MRARGAVDGTLPARASHVQAPIAFSLLHLQAQCRSVLFLEGTGLEISAGICLALRVLG